MVYGGFKINLEEQLLTKYYAILAFNIAKNSKNEGHQRGLASTVYKPFDNTSAGAKTSGGAVNS